MTHTHKTPQEKLSCLLNFGICYTNIQISDKVKSKHGFSNEPANISFDKDRLNPLKK